MTELARCYARESLTSPFLPRPWVFLAGPTPRDMQTPSWRPTAYTHLCNLATDGFDVGTVLIPEDEDFAAFDPVNSDAQVEWEWDALDQSDAILFWVPRDMAVLPGMTTNVEFGMFAASGKIVLGYPPEAEHVQYLERVAHRYNAPVARELHVACTHAALLARIRFNSMEGAEQ